jgi:hypothetical protein
MSHEKAYSALELLNEGTTRSFLGRDDALKVVAMTLACYLYASREVPPPNQTVAGIADEVLAWLEKADDISDGDPR